MAPKDTLLYLWACPDYITIFQNKTHQQNKYFPIHPITCHCISIQINTTTPKPRPPQPSNLDSKHPRPQQRPPEKPPPHFAHTHGTIIVVDKKFSIRSDRPPNNGTFTGATEYREIGQMSCRTKGVHFRW